MGNSDVKHERDNSGQKERTDRGPKLSGIDFKRGAIEYPDRLDESNRYHLFTKPFYNLANKISRWVGEGLDEDTYRHFCDFANIAYMLALPAGARILDVGCGPGWMCEYFARLGYKMTGLDISPELIRIANERVSKLPYNVDQTTPLSCRFLVHDIEIAPLPERFDAVICYDALHHFEDEKAVLKNVAAMLRPGGQFFLAEGERPPQGSDNEAELLEVMRQYQTLESPFSRDYLLDLLPRKGFAVVGDYTMVSGLVDRENVDGQKLLFVESPAFNYLLCKKTGASPEPDSRQPGMLRADFSLQSTLSPKVAPSSRIEFEVEVKNTGDTIWLVSAAPLRGRVRVGLTIQNDQGETIDEIHGWPRLQKAIAPGEKTLLRISCQSPAKPGNYILKVDLVNQDICWFEQHGSKPMILPFTVQKS